MMLFMTGHTVGLQTDRCPLDISISQQAHCTVPVLLSEKQQVNLSIVLGVQLHAKHSTGY